MSDKYPKTWAEWEEHESDDPFHATRATPEEFRTREEVEAAREAKRAQRAAYMRNWRKKHPTSRRALLEAEVERLRAELGEGFSIEVVKDEPEHDEPEEALDPLNPPYRYRDE